jgi:hypothetical protein
MGLRLNWARAVPKRAAAQGVGGKLSDEYAPEPEYETEPLRGSRGRAGKVVTLAVLIAAIAGGVFIWISYPELISFPPAGAAAPAAKSEDKMRLEELMSMHEQSVADIEAIKQQIAGEQAVLKAIYDQLATLAGRVAAIENVPQPPASAPVPVAPKPNVAAKPKANAPSRTNGPVSVGGAPLTGARPQ